MIWVNGRPAEYIKAPKELQLFSEYVFGSRQAGCVSQAAPELPEWDRHTESSVSGQQNTIRLGEVSTLGAGSFPRNHSADMTLDEFHLWRLDSPFSRFSGGVELGMAQAIQDEVIDLRKIAVKQWAAGRYYRPADDAVFISGPIAMNLQDRQLPPGSTGPTPLPSVATGSRSVPLPGSHSGPGTTIAAPPAVPTTPTGVTAVAPSRRTRLLAMSWTWYPEDQSRLTGTPLVYDYRPKIAGQYGAAESYVHSEDDDVSDGEGDDGRSDASYRGAGALDLAPSKSSFKWNPDVEKMTTFALPQDSSHCTVKLRVVDPKGVPRRDIESDGALGFHDPGYSLIRNGRTGMPVDLVGDDALQYEVQFRIQGLKPDSILLGSPVFDDITFYLAQDDIEFLSFTQPDVPR